MSKSPRTAARRAAGGRPGRSGRWCRVGHVVVAQRPALDEAEHQQAVLRPVLDDRRAHAGRRGGHRVAVLVVAVDGRAGRRASEQTRATNVPSGVVTL